MPSTVFPELGLGMTNPGSRMHKETNGTLQNVCDAVYVQINKTVQCVSVDTGIHIQHFCVYEHMPKYRKKTL